MPFAWLQEKAGAVEEWKYVARLNMAFAAVPQQEAYPTYPHGIILKHIHFWLSMHQWQQTGYAGFGYYFQINDADDKQTYRSKIEKTFSKEQKLMNW